MRNTSLIAAVALSVALAACGSKPLEFDDNDVGGVQFPTMSFRDLRAGESAFSEVNIRGAGTLTATADWGLAANDVDVFVTSTPCSGGPGAPGSCPIVGRTSSTATKPERLVVNVTPGLYRVWVSNLGPGPETGTVSIRGTLALP